MYLNELGLRLTSSPFDWLCGVDLCRNAQTLSERFANFLKRENIVWHVQGRDDRSNDVYRDIANGYVHIHDFPKGMSLDESYPLVREKYDRRITRLLERLDGGCTICFVWRSNGGVTEDADCVSAVKMMREAFSASDIRLLVMQDIPSFEAGRLEVRDLAGGLCVKAEGHFRSDDPEDMTGDRNWHLRVLGALRRSAEGAKAWRKHALGRAIAHLMSLGHLSREGRKRSRLYWMARILKTKSSSVGW